MTPSLIAPMTSGRPEANSDGPRLSLSAEHPTEPPVDPSRRPTLSWRRERTNGTEQLNSMRARSLAPGVQQPNHCSPPGISNSRVGFSPSESEETEVRVKGINFTTGLEAITRLYGPTARNCIEKETPGDVGNALRFGGIVIGGWYSVAWYRGFWKAICDKLVADEAAARAIGKCATEISVNVAYRTLASMTSASLLLAMSTRTFGYYFQRGALEVTQPLPNRITARWRNCNGFNKTIWSVIEGACIYFIEGTGAKDVVFSVISGGTDTSHMLANATWR